MRNVDVRVSFQVLRKSGELGLKGVRIEGKSNKEGNFSASNEDAVPQVAVSAHKEGYYRSSKIVKFTSESRFPIHWNPWNPTIEIILKKKRNPIAMYAKHTDAIKVPLFDKSIGYDLEKGDLVFPDGAIGDVLQIIRFFLSLVTYDKSSHAKTIKNQRPRGCSSYYCEGY
jgi:hypothetical protein